VPLVPGTALQLDSRRSFTLCMLAACVGELFDLSSGPGFSHAHSVDELTSRSNLAWQQ
jgi:hypothetical protein